MNEIPELEVKTDTGTGSLISETREPVAYHLDDSDSMMTEVAPTYLYIWENEREERHGELCEEINYLRNKYVFATAIVYAEELRDLVPLSGEQLTAYAWALTLGLWDNNVKDGEDAEQLLSEVSEQL